jgi:hypothetical protein
MGPKTEKVIDPEAIKWIEERKDRRDDEEYFASQWKRALSEAQAHAKPHGKEAESAPGR